MKIPSRAAFTFAAKQLLRRAWSAIDWFAFTPASAAPLSVLRIGLGVVLLAQALVVAPALFDLVGDTGILQGPIRDAIAEKHLPSVGWLVSAFSRLGVAEAPVIIGTGLVYIMALLALIAGLQTRTAAAIAWLSHLLLSAAADRGLYGVDEFANLFLFYLIWMPSGAVLSLDRRLGRAPFDPTPSARLALRIVQIQLCFVYLIGGVEKALDHPWWTGEAMWRALMLPEYTQLDFAWLANHAWVAKAAGWAVLVVEIGYPIFIWPRLTRRAWVAAAVSLHVGIAVLMGLHFFGAIMVVFTAAAFGVSAEPVPAPTRVADEHPIDLGAAPARQGVLRLLAVLGAIVLAGAVLGMMSVVPADHSTVLVDDLGIIDEHVTVNEATPLPATTPDASSPAPRSPAGDPPPPSLPAASILPD